MSDHPQQAPEIEAREGVPTGELQPLSEEEAVARARRNKSIAFGVVAFIVIVFATTVLRLAQNTGGV